MVAGGVLHQPVASITVQHVSASRTCNSEWRFHAFGEHGHGAIPVKTGLAADCPWKRVVLRIEAVAGHAPAVAGRSGDQCITGQVPVNAHGADEGISAECKLD